MCGGRSARVWKLTYAVETAEMSENNQLPNHMNRVINAHQLTVDENNGHTELRLKLSTHGFRFLAVTVINGTITASFEEETSGGGANESFFVFKNGEPVRTRLEYLATF